MGRPMKSFVKSNNDRTQIEIGFTLRRVPTVRISPQDDGTVFYSKWDYKKEEYVQCSPKVALRMLVKENAYVEVAVNDPKDPHSHFEAGAEMRRI